MRTLSLSLISIILICGIIQASEAQEAKPVFEMSVRNHYGLNVTRVFKSGNSWVCKTELTPYHEVSKSPVDNLELERLLRVQGRARQIASDCKERVFIIDRRVKKPKELVGCLDDNADLSRFVGRVSSLCGR